MRKGEWFVVVFSILVCLSTAASALRNPAAIYCNELGHTSETVKNDDGSEKDVCRIAELGIDCDSWEFYKGTCGKDANICARNGLDTITADDGKNAFSQEYAVCVEKQNIISGLATYFATLPGVTGFASYLVTGMATDEEPIDVGIAASDMMNLSKLSEEDSTEFIQALKTEASTESIQADTSSLPSSFSYRDYEGNNWVTPVKNQGGCGSCWAFGATAVAENAFKTSRWDPTFDPDLSEQEVVSCSGAGSCSGGYHTSAINWIKNNGLVDESCMPYTATNGVCTSKCSDSAMRKWKVTNGGYVYSPSTDTIKSYIYNYGPVAMNLCWYNHAYWSNGVYRCDNTYDNDATLLVYCDGGHVVTAVGWDDAGGYWIIKNSWGSTWNGDGYLKIGYNECGIGDTSIGYMAWAYKSRTPYSMRYASGTSALR